MRQRILGQAPGNKEVDCRCPDEIETSFFKELSHI